MVERRANYHARRKFEDLRTDLSRRLARACNHLQHSDFAELVASMARVQLRFDGVTAVPARNSYRLPDAMDR